MFSTTRTNITNPLDAHDKVIKDKLTEEFGEYPSDMMAMFARAIELGATLDLLGRLADHCYTTKSRGFEVTGLPYIQMLLDARDEAGNRRFPRAVVRDLFVRLCLIEGWNDERRYHNEGFWEDASAMWLFDNPDQLVAFACAQAEIEPNRALAHRGILAYWLGCLRRGLTNPDSIASVTLKEELTEAGMADARIVMMRAARHVNWVRSYAELAVLLELPLADVATAATRCDSNWPRNLILQGFALGHHLVSGENEGWIRSQITEEIQAHPERAPEIYRWVLEGIRQAGGEQYWQFNRLYDYLRYLVAEAGWEFKRLTSHDNPRRPGEPDLQVEITGHSGRIVLKHSNRGTRHDRLREGDEVIVPTVSMIEQLKWAPVFQKGHLSIYSTELWAAAPPSDPMKDHCQETGRFYGEQ
jgi:hypothetical protein